jgi:hypothetical protein
MRTRIHPILPVILMAALAVACGRSEEAAPPAPAAPAPLAVASVDLGSAIDAERRVVEAKTTFAPTDAIYASVATTGTGTAASLMARWTFEDGQVVNETTQTISPTGPAVTEFHITKETPWPAGRYTVEILLNGASAMTKEFTVGG